MVHQPRRVPGAPARRVRVGACPGPRCRRGDTRSPCRPPLVGCGTRPAGVARPRLAVARHPGRRLETAPTWTHPSRPSCSCSSLPPECRSSSSPAPARCCSAGAPISARAASPYRLYAHLECRLARGAGVVSAARRAASRRVPAGPLVGRGVRGVCGGADWRARGVGRARPDAAATARLGRAGPPATARPRTGTTIAQGDAVLWLLLAALPSALLQATTTRLTQDIAAVPFLWMVPLALYLLTFIVAFEWPAACPRRALAVLLVAGALATLVPWSDTDRVGADAVDAGGGRPRPARRTGAAGPGPPNGSRAITSPSRPAASPAAPWSPSVPRSSSRGIIEYPLAPGRARCSRSATLQCHATADSLPIAARRRARLLAEGLLLAALVAPRRPRRPSRGSWPSRSPTRRAASSAPSACASMTLRRRRALSPVHPRHDAARRAVPRRAAATTADGVLHVARAASAGR